MHLGESFPQKLNVTVEAVIYFQRPLLYFLFFVYLFIYFLGGCRVCGAKELSVTTAGARRMTKYGQRSWMLWRKDGNRGQLFISLMVRNLFSDAQLETASSLPV